MRVVYSAEQRFWLHVPSEFPAQGFANADEWVSDVVSRYRSGRPDAPADELDAVRRLAGQARAELLPNAEFGLQFWPFPSPVALLVNVEVGPPLSPHADLLAELVDDVPLATVPSVDRVDVPGVGSGIAARFIVHAADARSAVAVLGYVLSGADCSLRIMTSPTTTTMVGLIDEPLRDLVMSMRLTA